VFWQDCVMTAAVIWLVAGLALIAAEVLSGEFVLLMIGGGALAAAGASAVVDGSPLFGVGVFAVASVLLLFAVRPMLRRRLERGIDHSVMHHRALVGNTAFVVTRVDGHSGQVKIGGDLWSARSFGGELVIEPGQKVIVMEISGATALVVPQD
jgi:membrane protein implicated in regulation of membrane protease activity